MRKLTCALSLLSVLFLAACGGGASLGDGGDGSSLGGSTTGGATTGGSTTTPVYRMGVLNGTTFAAGQIAVGQTPLEAGGSSGLRVDIVDTANGNVPITDAVNVTFSSACVSQGRASVQTPVVATAGSASSTYQALGCSGDDTVVASATVDGTSLSASGTLTVLPAPVAAIQFTSVSTSSIRIKGTGSPQTSAVRFTVTNIAGGPVEGQKVKFSLDTTAGGITFSPATGTTDSDGVVQTTVAAGTVHTSVRVTATAVDDSGAALAGVPPAQSDSLVISTGLADQNSFSISVGCFNIEGNDYDGTTTSVNMLASDRFNNPVPDGTAISFVAEGGQIQSECLTSGGGCSVDFKSSEPRTTDHRVTILATAVGEESFVDTNGNGQYDSGESFTDLDEAFLDRNENGTRDSTEEIVDFNNNGHFDTKSGNFTGVLCKSGCDSATSLSVRAFVPIIMSGSTATLLASPSTADITNGPVAVRVTVGDSANQPMPGGTTITASTSFGSIVGDASYTQACSTFNGPFTYTFVVQAPDGQTDAKSGVMTVKVTTPKGTVTSISIPVIFNPNVGGGTAQPPGTLKSINFVSAAPSTISIKGTGIGQPETSLVTFQVLSDTGMPVAGQTVTFAPDTTAGGISLDKTSAVSDGSGNVQVNVSAGTIHTSVRITATANNGTTTVSARSDTLVISTGLADQDSFSLSATQLNIEGQDFDGETTTITARLADRFNNPVPDGTAVSFTAEGGSVEPQCTTSGGACSVVFTSQNPRVADHRYTVLATAIGEESFTDLNGNGAYDSTEPFGDFGEAFSDYDENGARNPLTEPFLDFNNDASFNVPSGNFTGPLCNSGCDVAKTLNVRQSMVIVMSGSPAKIVSNLNLVTVATNRTQLITVRLSDSADQNMVGGTTLKASTTYGSISGTTSYTQADSNLNMGGTDYSFVVVGGASDGIGTMTLTATTPNGVVTNQSVCVRSKGPTANASSDQTVVAGTLVTLDASGSTVANGSSTKYAWTQKSGSAVILSGADTDKPSFTVPASASSGQSFIFEVLVSDDCGVAGGDTDTITITVL